MYERNITHYRFYKRETRLYDCISTFTITIINKFPAYFTHNYRKFIVHRNSVSIFEELEFLRAQISEFTIGAHFTEVQSKQLQSHYSSTSNTRPESSHTLSAAPMQPHFTGHLKPRHNFLTRFSQFQCYFVKADNFRKI